MALRGKTIANTYKDLLQLDNSNNGLQSIEDVKDGQGATQLLHLKLQILRAVRFLL